MSDMRTITRRSPFTAFTTLEREIRSLADRIGVTGIFEDFDWKPVTDMYRDEGALVITAELPGIAGDDVTVEVVDNVLHVSGEKSRAREVEKEDRFITERTYGSFRREILLPDGVDPDAIVANCEDGVLTVRVTLPEPVEEAEPPPAVHIPVTS